MSKMTLQETICANLKRMGYIEQPGASSKYKVFHKEGSSAAWFWVGRAGSARFAGTKRYDSSRPAGPKARAKLLTPLDQPIQLFASQQPATTP